MVRGEPRSRVDGGAGTDKRLRAWLEYVAEFAIAWLDELDAASAELEDDDREGEVLT